MDVTDDMLDYLEASGRNWCPLPMPDSYFPLKDDAFDFVDEDALINAPTQLITTLLRSQANGGIQVISPRSTPCTEVLSRVINPTPQPDLIVVTTHASENTTWPTCDGRDLTKLIGDVPFMSKYRDTAQERPEVTNAIKPQTFDEETGDIAARAILKAAALVNLQSRDDVRGDARALAEIVDRMWDFPDGTTLSVAALCIPKHADLLRTAIDPDKGKSGVLMPVHFQKIVGVGGGIVTKREYGNYVASNWARQKAIARAIFYRSMCLEGQSFASTPKTYSANDPTAPLTESERDKFLVFQPRFGSMFSHDPKSFRLNFGQYRPPRYEGCYGRISIHNIDDARSYYDKIESCRGGALPDNAIDSILKVLADSVQILVMKPNQSKRSAVAPHTGETTLREPRNSSISAATITVVTNLLPGLRRGQNISRVIRSQMMSIIDATVSSRYSSVAYTIYELKKVEKHFSMSFLTTTMYLQLAKRMAYEFGSQFMSSLAFEASRRESAIEAWVGVARDVMPSRLRLDVDIKIQISIFAIHCMWMGTTTKWKAAVRMSRLNYMQILDEGAPHSIVVTQHDTRKDRILKAANAAMNAQVDMYAPYYRTMMDIAFFVTDYTSCRPISVDRWVEESNLTYSEARKRAKEARSIIKLSGAAWQVRSRMLNSLFIKILDGDDVNVPQNAHHRVLRYAGYTVVLGVAPYSAFSGFAREYNAAPVRRKTMRLSETVTGAISAYILTCGKTMFGDLDEFIDDSWKDLRLFRYAANFHELAHDIEKTLDLISADINITIARVLQISDATVNIDEAYPIADLDDATVAEITGISSTNESSDNQIPEEVDDRENTDVLEDMVRALRKPNKPTKEAKQGWLLIKRYGEEHENIIDDLAVVMGEVESFAFLCAPYEDESRFYEIVDGAIDAVDKAAVAESGATAAIYDPR